MNIFVVARPKTFTARKGTVNRKGTQKLKKRENRTLDYLSFAFTEKYLNPLNCRKLHPVLPMDSRILQVIT